VLPVIPTQTVDEQTLLTVTNTASEPNIHAATTGYGILSPLPGMSIDTSGIFTWTPNQTQSPGTNLVTVVVTNSDSFDTVHPVLTATNSFTVIVREINIAPVLPIVPTQNVSVATLLTVTNTATEPNIHAVTVGYGLVNPPAGASISAGGIFTWTPSVAGTNTITTVVTNNDSFDLVNPLLTATNSFTVVVMGGTNSSPLTIQSIVLSNGVIVLNWNSVAGLIYAVQFKASLASTNWLQLGGLILATNTMSSATDTNVNGQRFYRVEQVVLSSNTPPVLQSIVSADGNVVLTWSAVPGDTYQVQYKQSLAATNWTAISPNVTASGLTASLTNAVGASSMEFFRVLIVP